MAPSLRRLLVTGGAGFIGSAFVRQRLKSDQEVAITVLDKLTYAGSEENLAELRGDRRLRFVKGDICDPATVDKLARDADAIVNFAAESHVDRSLLDAGAFVQTDVYGTYVLLEAARKHRHQRFVQVSTDEVYHASFGLPTLITRGANTYGPYQFPEKIIPLFITNALQNLPLPIYGNGSAVRDYLYVEDHVSAIATVLRNGEPGRAYNVGAGAEVSGLTVADTVLEFCGKPSSLKQFVKDRPGHDYRYALEVDRIRPLGWQSRISFRDGMRLTVDWYQKHDAWWRRRKETDFWTYYRRNYQGLPSGAIPT